MSDNTGRISVDFDNQLPRRWDHEVTTGLSESIDVYVDGAYIPSCIGYDIDGGWATGFFVDGDGSIYLWHNLQQGVSPILEKTYYGKVEIKPASKPRHGFNIIGNGIKRFVVDPVDGEKVWVGVDDR